MNSLNAIAMAKAQPSKKGVSATTEGKKRLREAQTREEGKKLSYDRIAEKVYTSRSTVERFFNGKPIEIATAKKIVDFLDIKLDDVVDISHLQSSESVLEEAQQQTIPDDIFTKMLAEQIKRMTSNPLTAGDGITLERKKMYVPLGLMERRKKPRVKDREAENRSRFYNSEKEITRRFENDEFFCEVIEGGNSLKSQGKRIAIIGEPGAGKTTLLQQIVDRVSQTHPEDRIIWVSLADLQGENLEDYLLDKWLKIALKTFEVKPESKQALVDIFNTERVWLLLDGLDEMGINNPLFWMRDQIGQGWLAEARIVLTCRLNVWDNGKNYLDNFDVYQNLDFDDEQVKRFIDSFFINNYEHSLSLKSELNKSEKEHIRDLIKNPLQLTLLCYAWQKREGNLPETKAGLYEWFVDTFYEWKSEYFPTTSSQREELNRALGELAKEAINRSSDRFRLSREQVVKHLGEIDQPLGKLALDIGWLNIVGVAEENPEEEVYAFFHASFQEYFAALVIDDCQFFLDHIPDNPDKGVYRVFENQWKEVIVLWIGMDKVNPNIKNNLIKLLITFTDGFCGENFYGYRAYFLASLFVSEFKECQLIDEIIVYLTQVAFLSNHNTIYGYDKPKTNLAYLARQSLLSINKEKVGEHLSTLLKSNREASPTLINTLLIISPSDYFAIQIASEFVRELTKYRNKIFDFLTVRDLEDKYIDYLNQHDENFIDIWSNNLAIIVQYNPTLHYELLNLINDCYNTDIFFIVKVFITIYDQNLFKKALKIILKRSSSFNLQINSILLLYQIDVEDIDIQIYIDDLIETGETIDYLHSDILIFAQKILNINPDNQRVQDFVQNSLRFKEYLNPIDLQNILSDFSILKNQILALSDRSVTDDEKLNNVDTSQEIYDDCNAYSQIWNCAKNMTYPEFYQAWYGQTESSIPEELRSQNLNYILEKIKTKNPNVRTIDIKILNQEINIDRLAKAIGNRIFTKLISPINDIYDLEYYLKTETPNLALIFYGDNPGDSFMQLCQLISDFAYIAIITEEPVEQPIQGFLLNQINLENALQTWLEKMVK
jgi:transcriptional regulator with XRE-family HTH domain